MQIHNTTDRYGIVAKSLHWIVAILIILAWVIGYYMMEMPNDKPEKFHLFDIHKSIGMAVLMLAIIRLCWRLYDGNPGYNMLHRLYIVAAHTVHYFLYALMFIQPLTGWAMSSAAGHSPNFFGWFIFPNLVPVDETMAGTYFVLHNTAAMVLLALFGIHVAAALFHHFVLKDNVLLRMTTD